MALRTLDTFRQLLPWTPGRPRSRSRGSHACAALVTLAIAAGSAGAAGRAGAQTVAGAGDDAIPIAKGSVRIRVGGLWNDWDAAYVDSAGSYTRRPLLGGVGRQALGTRTLTQLQPVETAIRDLTGLQEFTLSLGTLEARGDVRQSIAPILIDVGVTRRVSIGLLVPYVESRDNTQLILNRSGTNVTVGANPAFGRTTGAATRVANGTVLREIARARALLAAEAARCAVASATGCEKIRANPTGVQQLLARSQQTESAISAVYGDSLRGGSPVVPFTATLLGEFVNGRVSTLRTAFEAFGVTAIAPNSLPVGATTAYGPGGLNAIAADSAFGLGYRRLGNTRRAGVGDIDLSASFLLFDSFDANQPLRLTGTGRALRSLVSVGWRFGTAGADNADDAFDVPIGDGASALLARSTTDLVFSRSLWMSATVRLVKPFADDRVVPVPLRTDSTIFTSFGVATARRSLGSRIELEVAPRYAVGDFFGLSAAYLFRRTGESTLDAGSESISAAPALFRSVSPMSTFQAASVGVSFSTLASYVRNRSRLPLEVIYTHTRPITASGGPVPAVSTDRLELRVYTGFPRR
jgi:hypothetical protein